MSDDSISTREQVRTSTQEEFAKAHTKAELTKIAEGLYTGEQLTEAKTKADFTALIYDKYPAPDPALRGKSTVDDPVLEVWALAHDTFAAAGDEKPRRKDIVQAGVDLGIAFYTVRTQYQAWYKLTSGGANMLTAKSDFEGAPKGLKERLFPEK